MRLARQFGEIDVAPFGPKHPDVPELTVLDQQAPKDQGADAWHSDNTFLAAPPKYTMLQAVQLPATGGDTCWANMYQAYEFQCRYRCQPGTLAMWDNSRLQHYAVPDYTSRHIMHRFTIAGDRPL